MRELLKSYRHRLYACLVISLLLLIASWKFAFHKTIKLAQENAALTQQIANGSAIQNRYKQLLLKEKQLKRFGFQDNAEQNARDNIFQLISNNNRLSIVSVFPKQQHHYKEYVVEQNRFLVSGSFKDILKAIYQIEEIERAAKIASLSLYRSRIENNRKYRLVADLNFQNILIK